jgi:hypothetical protein
MSIDRPRKLQKVTKNIQPCIGSSQTGASHKLSNDQPEKSVANRPRLGCYSPARSRFSHADVAEGSAV